MEELGPIRTLICGSSVITVIYIPASAAGVTVSWKASTSAEVDAKIVPKEIRTITMAGIRG
jgi:hypothetical protein